MSDKRPAPAFLTMFVPGLVIGLVVGGMAGAFLTPVMESGNLSDLTTDPSKPFVPAGPREDRVHTPDPTQPAQVPEQMPEHKPEVPPGTPTTTPETKPTDPPVAPAPTPAPVPVNPG